MYTYTLDFACQRLISMKSDDTGPAYDFVLPHVLKKSGYEAQQSPLFMFLLPFLTLTVHIQQQVLNFA